MRSENTQRKIKTLIYGLKFLNKKLVEINNTGQLSDDIDDMGIVVVEDEPEVDREMINEMRRAYLEEARSQDTSE